MHLGRIAKTGLFLAAVLLIAGCVGTYGYDYDYGYYGQGHPYYDYGYYNRPYETPFAFGSVAPHRDFDYGRFRRGDRDWDRHRWPG